MRRMSTFFAVMIRTIQTQTSLHIDQHIICFQGNMIAFFAISTCVRACARVLKLRYPNMCVAMCLLLLIHFIVWWGFCVWFLVFVMQFFVSFLASQSSRWGRENWLSSCCHMAVNYVYLIHGSVKWSLLLDDSHEISCLIFCWKLGKMSQNVSSAAVVIGTLRVKMMYFCPWILFLSLTNNADRDKMPPYAAFHLGFHCSVFTKDPKWKSSSRANMILLHAKNKGTDQFVHVECLACICSWTGWFQIFLFMHVECLASSCSWTGSFQFYSQTSKTDFLAMRPISSYLYYKYLIMCCNKRI